MIRFVDEPFRDRHQDVQEGGPPTFREFCKLSKFQPEIEETRHKEAFTHKE